LTYLRSPRRPAHEKFRKELEDLLSRVKGNWGSELRPLLDLRQRLRSVLIELDTAISLIRSQRPEPVITVAPVDLFGHYQGHSHYVDSSFAFTYPVKITEDKKSVHVACNFAGAHHEDLEVTLRDNVLTIACEVKDQKPVQTPSDAQRLIVGKYQRSMVVPSTVDQSKIEANFKDGVLSVELPKSADVQSDVRYIPVLWPGTTRY
jgi:HSP20 family protein